MSHLGHYRMTINLSEPNSGLSTTYTRNIFIDIIKNQHEPLTAIKMSRRINKSQISILRHISPVTRRNSEAPRARFFLLFHFFILRFVACKIQNRAYIVYDSFLLLIGSCPAKVRLLLENPPRPVFMQVEETRESGRETACKSSLFDGIVVSFALDQISY